MLRPTALTAGLGLLALAACQPSTKPQLPTAADTAAIEKVRTDYVAAWNAGKVDDVLKLYASDGQLLPADRRPVVGSNAIRTYFNTALGTPSRPTLVVPAGTLVGRQDLAVYTGSDTLTIPAPAPAAEPARRGRAAPTPPAPTVISGKYIVVLLKQPDGGWKIAYHAEAPDAPMPAAPPAPKPEQ